jgi:HSP20 family protein
MLMRFDDLDRTFVVMDQLRRRMDRLFDEVEPAKRRTGPEGDVEGMYSGHFPRVTVSEDAASLVLRADLPGLSEKDVQLTILKDALTVSGERRPDAPQGHYVHRQERAPVRFSRSFSLPCKVDAEKSGATLKNGVLTVTLAKTPDAQPRQIAIKAQA